MLNGAQDEMKIPATQEELDKAARTALKRIINPRKELTHDEMLRQGVPVGINGRPLRGARLREYMENGYITYQRKRK